MRKIYQISHPILPRVVKYRALTLKDITDISNISHEYLDESIYNDIHIVMENFDKYLDEIFSEITDINISTLNYVQKSILISSIISNTKDDSLSIEENFKNPEKEDDFKKIIFSFKISDGINKFAKKIEEFNIFKQYYQDYEVTLNIPNNTKELLSIENWVSSCTYEGKPIEYSEIPIKLYSTIKSEVSKFISIPLIDIVSTTINPYKKDEKIHKNITIPNLYFFFMIFIAEYFQ